MSEDAKSVSMNESVADSKSFGLSNEMYALLTKEDSRPTLEDSVEDSMKRINDSYSNSLLSIGSDDKVQSFTNYGFSNDTLNWMLWLALYNDSWVFKRAIDKPAQDEIRCGITLQGENEKFDNVYRRLKRYRFDLIQLLQWSTHPLQSAI